MRPRDVGNAAQRGRGSARLNPVSRNVTEDSSPARRALAPASAATRAILVCNGQLWLHCANPHLKQAP